MTLAWMAGVVDLMGVIRLRTTQDGTELPMLALHGHHTRVLQVFAGYTGTKVTVTRRNYTKHNCAEHCPGPHADVRSVSGRWSVTGVKATVVLSAILPYLRVQRLQAEEMISLGRNAPRKPATIRNMVGLGWPVPEEWR